MAVARAQLNSLDEIAAGIQLSLTEATDRAQNSAKSGTTTEMQSLRLVSDARLQAAADLQQVANAFEEVARASGDPRMIQQARAMKIEVENLAASADLVRERFENAFTGPLESAIDKLISGTASFKDAVKGLFSGIAAEMSRMLSQDFAKQLLGKNGPLGGAVDVFAGVFGGKSKAPATSGDVAGALVKATGGTADTAAAAAASTALTTLASSTATADAALLTMGTTIPVANGALAAMGTTTLTADGALVSLAASASIAAAALAAVAATGGGEVASSAAYAAFDFLASAKGNIFAGGNVIPFAKGGIPDVVSAPTFFPMKNGRTGLMGEAGPEAIMPLARDAAGDLAVRMVGEGGNVTLLPITRDVGGRMAVRSADKAFATGGVLGGEEPARWQGARRILEHASTTPSGRPDAIAVPAGIGSVDQGGIIRAGDTIHLNVHVTPPPGASTASASQWGAQAGRQIRRSMGRNT
jgi:phage-related minor tail protein